jgi:hypothetical protein
MPVAMRVRPHREFSGRMVQVVRVVVMLVLMLHRLMHMQMA